MAAHDANGHPTAPRSPQALAERIGRVGVQAAVHDFYAAVREHPSLAGAFARVTDWDDHEARMALFWWAALDGRPYSSVCATAVPRDAAVRIPAALVNDWERLLHAAIRGRLAPGLAEAWIARAGTVVATLRRVGDYYERHGVRRG